MSIYDDINGQFIDRCGKVRVLRYNNGVFLITSPLPPKNVEILSEFGEVDLPTALEFIKTYGMKLEYQDITFNETKTIGLWVSHKDLMYGYIPLEESDIMEGIPFSDPQRIDPFQVDFESIIEQYKKDKKISEILKQYTLWNYSRNIQKSKTFDKNNFLIDENVEYEVTNAFSESSSFMREGKIIVPSEELISSLLAFLEGSLLHDKEGTLSFANKTFIVNNYQNVFDFRQSRDQIIFLDKKSLLEWIERTKKLSDNIIHYNWNGDTIEPYFYRNLKIRGGVTCMVQNVKGVGDKSKQRALAVAHIWKDKKINTGFYTLPIDKDLSHVIYDVDTNKKYLNGKSNESIHVMKYDGNRYAAILTL